MMASRCTSLRPLTLPRSVSVVLNSKSRTATATLPWAAPKAAAMTPATAAGSNPSSEISLSDKLVLTSAGGGAGGSGDGGGGGSGGGDGSGGLGLGGGAPPGGHGGGTGGGGSRGGGGPGGGEGGAGEGGGGLGGGGEAYAICTDLTTGATFTPE